MCDICGDNRFEIIDRAKEALIESTNIETSPKEMEVLDDFLFRCWQMGWIEKYEIVRCKDCNNRHTDDCPMYHEEWYEIDEGDGYVDNDFTVHDCSTDDGFCSWAKMKGGTE